MTGLWTKILSRLRGQCAFPLYTSPNRNRRRKPFLIPIEDGYSFRKFLTITVQPWPSGVFVVANYFSLQNIESKDDSTPVGAARPSMIRIKIKNILYVMKTAAFGETIADDVVSGKYTSNLQNKQKGKCSIIILTRVRTANNTIMSRRNGQC